MPINLTNREDIICNSLKIVTNSQTINIEEKLNNTYDKTTVNNMLSNVVGLPPSTLNSLEKVSTALDNDPTFFTTINTKLDAKAPILTTSTKTELSDAVSTINTSIGNKQNKFLIAETIPTNTARLFDSGNTKFRALNVNAPLSITTPNYDYLSLSCDAYDKANIDGKITTINNTLETKATTTTVNTKQDKLVLGTSITGSQSLFNTTTSKLKNIVGTNLTLTSDVDNLTITGIDAYDKTNIDGKITTINNNISAKRNTSDSYTKTEVDQKISDLVGTAPALLNTLQEISTSLNNDPSFNTTVVNSLSTKANTTDTFLKQTINSNDISLSGLGNYRHVSYSQNINDFKYSLEYYDNIANGRVPNYLWNNIFNVVWDAVTAKSKMYIPDALYINNVDVLTTLNAKANTSSLSSYATTSSLSSYALTANTFSKSTVSNDVYLTLDNNKRIVGTSTANQFKFQILDNQGASFTDAWIDVGIIDFNITTKKAKFTIKDSLFIDTTDVLTTLNAKANTSSLSSYALTSSLSSYALASSLSSYALTSSLSSYATTSSLSSYALTSALSSYALLNGATYTGIVTGPTINSTNSTITTLLTVPQIMFNTNSNAPTLTTRSTGTKLVLYPSLTSTTADYAIGTEGSNMWLSVAGDAVGNGFKFYGKTTNVATISGNGNFSCNGSITCSGLTVNGSNISTSLSNVYTKTEADARYLQQNVVFDLNIAQANCEQLNASKSLPSGGNVTINATNTGLNGLSSLYLKTTGQTINETGQIFVGQQLGLTMMTRTAHPLSFKTYVDESGVTVPTSMQILGTGTREVQILAPLKCLSSVSTFDNTVSIGGSLSSTSNCLSCTGGATFGGNITTTGILKAPQIRITGSSANDGIIIQNVDGTEVAKFHNDFRCRMNGNTTVLGDLEATGEIYSQMGVKCNNFISDSINGVTLRCINTNSLKLGAGSNDPEPQIEITGTSARTIIMKTPTLINNDLTIRDSLLCSSILPKITSSTIALVGNVSVSSILSCSSIKSIGTDGISLLRSAGSTALRVYDNTGNVEIPNDLYVAGTLSATKGPWFCAGRINTGAPSGTITSNYGRVSFSIYRDAQASITITMATAHPQGTGYCVFASSPRPFTTVENLASGVGARTSTSFQIVLRNTDFSTLASDTNGLTFMVV